MNDKCTVSEQESKYADQPEQLSASEHLSVLKRDMLIAIGEQTYDLDDITNKLCVTELRIAAEESVTDNANAINELYIKKIAEMMG